MNLTNSFDLFTAHEKALPQLKVVFEHSSDEIELPILCLDATDVDVRNLVYSQAEYDETVAEDGTALLVNDQTIEKGYVYVADAYRGTGVYNAVLKVDGKWWDCDVVCEGVAYEVKLTDEEVEQLVNEYIAADLAGEEE